MELSLYHASERPSIVRFEPRPVRAESGLTEEVVWAIDDEHLQNYLLPRECPRVTFYSSVLVHQDEECPAEGLLAHPSIVDELTALLDEVGNYLGEGADGQEELRAGHHSLRPSCLPGIVEAGGRAFLNRDERAADGARDCPRVFLGELNPLVRRQVGEAHRGDGSSAPLASEVHLDQPGGDHPSENDEHNPNHCPRHLATTSAFDSDGRV